MSASYAEDGDGLKIIEQQTARVGTVLQLPADTIHGIANPGLQTARALHLYGGDLAGLADDRTLWDADSHHELRFSFPALVQQSVKTMARSDNDAGLEALIEAIPAAKGAVDAVRGVRP